MRVFIEISKNTNVKYEHDKDNNCLVLDRILHNSNYFPYNYGYIPNTLSPDGDPLDVIIICDYQIFPGCMADCKVIGGIETEDENGKDDKILMVLGDKLDPKSKHINDVKDINKMELDNILYFLRHYKDNEEDKYVNVGKIYNKKKAEKVIKECKINKEQ